MERESRPLATLLLLEQLDSLSSTCVQHRDRSLAKAPLPQISERAAQRYGVNKRAWERQAARAQF